MVERNSAEASIAKAAALSALKNVGCEVRSEQRRIASELMQLKSDKNEITDNFKEPSRLNIRDAKIVKTLAQNLKEK